MANYKRVLVAVDLTSESDQVLQRAVDIAERNGAALHLIHVIEIVSFAYGGDVPMDLTSLQEQIDKHANERINAKKAALNYKVEEAVVATGNTEEEIHQHAAKIGADLIVIGSHGRHGLALLLGSTSNGVLHGAKCDILAVHLSAAD